MPIISTVSRRLSCRMPDASLPVARASAAILGIGSILLSTLSVIRLLDDEGWVVAE
jgi:hypothetical protein